MEAIEEPVLESLYNSRQPHNRSVGAITGGKRNHKNLLELVKTVGLEYQDIEGANVSFTADKDCHSPTCLDQTIKFLPSEC